MTTAPRFESVWFHGDSHQYSRLARVLEHTVREHCPGWYVNVTEVEPTAVRGPSGTQSHADNSWKLGHWARFVVEAPDGARLLLTDVDMFVTRDLDPLWDVDFDIAYTVRPADCRLPLNGGVVAVRVSPMTRAFMEAWLATDRQFLADPEEHRPWRKKFGGMNQASFGRMLASPGGVKFAALPCLEWNCEDSSWVDFDPEVTRIVHVKSALRMAVFGIGPRARKVKPLARMWSDLDKTLTVPAQ